MKKITLLLTAALTSAVVSSSFASYAPVSDAPKHVNVAPVPLEVVRPTNLPQRYNNATVNLLMTIDEKGVPHNVRLMGHSDDELESRLLPAVSQWRFTPSMIDGHPVRRHVIMPLQLAPGA